MPLPSSGGWEGQKNSLKPPQYMASTNSDNYLPRSSASYKNLTTLYNKMTIFLMYVFFFINYIKKLISPFFQKLFELNAIQNPLIVHSSLK